jgi:hypothetical protein
LTREDYKGEMGDSEKEAPAFSLGYARPPRGFFRELYFTIGVLCLLMGAVLFVIDVVVLIALVAASGSVGNGYGGMLANVLIRGFLSVVADVLIVIGCVGSFWRSGWSRRMILLGLGSQIVIFSVTIGMFLFGNSTGPSRVHSSFEMMAFLVAMARIAGPFLFYLAYRNMRADFYFRGDTNGFVPANPGYVVPIITAPVQSQKYNFRIRGTDSNSRREVDFLSKAATRELAMKSAGMMGLDPSTVVVEEIEGE